MLAHRIEIKANQCSMSNEPLTVYLGRKQAKELRLHLGQTSKLYLYGIVELTLRYTRHKSYLRVVRTGSTS